MEDQRAVSESIQDHMSADGFAEQLRSLRAAVGNPSFRKMAGRSGRISHTTLHEAAAGTRFPSWETTREFVRACEADEDQWRCRWEDAQRRGTVDALPDSDLAPAALDPLAEVNGAITVGGAKAGVMDTRAPHVVDAPTVGRPVVLGVAVPPGPVRWLTASAVMVVVVTVAILGVNVRGRSSQGGSLAVTTSPSSATLSDSLIPGDSSKFVGDITIPDGSRVRVTTEFDKVWALANVGTVAWHDRFLARTSPTVDADGCRTPDRVAIGDTAPGEQVMIRVRVTAPSRPGKCWVSWKMVDENGREFFPTRRPVYFMVTIVA